MVGCFIFCILLAGTHTVHLHAVNDDEYVRRRRFITPVEQLCGQHTANADSLPSCDTTHTDDLSTEQLPQRRRTKEYRRKVYHWRKGYVIRVDDRGTGDQTALAHNASCISGSSSESGTRHVEESHCHEHKRQRVDNSTGWLAQFSEETSSLYRALDILTGADLQAACAAQADMFDLQGMSTTFADNWINVEENNTDKEIEEMMHAVREEEAAEQEALEESLRMEDRDREDDSQPLDEITDEDGLWIHPRSTSTTTTAYAITWDSTVITIEPGDPWLWNPTQVDHVSFEKMVHALSQGQAAEQEAPEDSLRMEEQDREEDTQMLEEITGEDGLWIQDRSTTTTTTAYAITWNTTVITIEPGDPWLWHPAENDHGTEDNDNISVWSTQDTIVTVRPWTLEGFIGCIEESYMENENTVPMATLLAFLHARDMRSVRGASNSMWISFSEAWEKTVEDSVMAMQETLDVETEGSGKRKFVDTPKKMTDAQYDLWTRTWKRRRKNNDAPIKEIQSNARRRDAAQNRRRLPDRGLPSYDLQGGMWSSSGITMSANGVVEH